MNKAHSLGPLQTPTVSPLRNYVHKHYSKLNSVALVRERTTPTKRPLLIGEVSANVCGERDVA
jgi:hypothetical protein